ncbi:MAG: nuclear transport factor 2 family protein [Solirubrobacteraceae bacterium]
MQRDDRREIEAVLVRFCRGVDRLDEELIASCFHEDSLDDHGMYRGTGRGFAEYVMRSASSMLATVHTIGNTTIEFSGGGTLARSEAYVHVVMRMPTGGGDREAAADHTIHARYLDRFERRGGGPWLIAERLVAYDLTRIDPVGREWTLGDGYTRGRRDRDDPSFRLSLGA